MNWFDITILIIVLFCGVLGFKRGFFKELVLFIGIILVFILSYKFKNYIGDFLVLNFPFLNFGDGVYTLNIIFYQSISFILVMIILYVIYELVVSMTGIFETILRFTIILGIPSKILGFVLGIIKGIVIVYVLVFFISQPLFKLNFIKDSEYAKFILKETPILNIITNETVNIIEEINDLVKLNNVNEVNLQVLDLILEKKVTSVDVINELVKKRKLNIKNIDVILDKYR